MLRSHLDSTGFAPFLHLATSQPGFQQLLLFLGWILPCPPPAVMMELGMGEAQGWYDQPPQLWLDPRG